MSKGIDSAQRVTQLATQIKDKGFAFVVRYYRTSHSSYPSLTRVEAKAISDAGLYVVSVFESASDNKSYFTAPQGASDAQTAHSEAVAAGQPAGTPIYFAVDYDAAISHLTHNISAYFDAVHDKLATLGGQSTYTIGVYGSGQSCTWLKEHKDYVTHTWLAESTDWTGSSNYQDWNMKQLRTTSLLGLDVDLDETRGNGGGWQI